MKVETTKEKMKNAFTEWHRRWKENPDSFQSNSEALAEDSSTYGGAVVDYFLEILGEVK
jgi:hypothetical protein